MAQAGNAVSFCQPAQICNLNNFELFSTQPWSEARESVEEVLDKIHNHASFAFSAALNDLIDRNYETVIRRDVIRVFKTPILTNAIEYNNLNI